MGADTTASARMALTIVTIARRDSVGKRTNLTKEGDRDNSRRNGSPKPHQPQGPQEPHVRLPVRIPVG